MPRRNPGKAVHERRARAHLATAENYVQLARGSAVAESVLTLAHCEACSAATEAASAKNEMLRQRAGELASKIARRFHRPEQNPLTGGAPPQFVQGMLGQDQVWTYKGREITVIRYPKMPDAPWQASWVTDEGDREESHGIDPGGALANARYNIDVTSNEAKWPGYYSAETMAHHVLDNMVDYGTGPIDRAALAREIEYVAKQVRRKPDVKPSLYGPRDLPIRSWGVVAFDGLALKERLRLLDELIDYQYRWGFIPEKRYRPTPTRRRLRNPKKRNTREERSRRLRRLLRV